MTTPRKCYQCDDDLPPMSEIQAARKKEIQDYARAQVEEAEEAVLVEEERFRSGREISDWDLIIQKDTEEPPEVAPVYRAEQVDALAQAEEQETNADKVAESPKPYGQAVDGEKDAEDNRVTPNNDTEPKPVVHGAPASSVPFEKAAAQPAKAKPVKKAAKAEKAEDKSTNATITGEVTITPDSE